MEINDKSLSDKAIDIKGKKYVMVADRVKFFNDTYPNGSIHTSLKENGDMVVMQASVTPDSANPNRYFTGYSQATWGEGFINRTAALENAETSAVGRALAFMGIGVLDSVASVDEIKKAEAREKFYGKITRPQTDTQKKINDVEKDTAQHESEELY